MMNFHFKWCSITDRARWGGAAARELTHPRRRTRGQRRPARRVHRIQFFVQNDWFCIRIAEFVIQNGVISEGRGVRRPRCDDRERRVSRSRLRLRLEDCERWHKAILTTAWASTASARMIVITELHRSLRHCLKSFTSPPENDRLKWSPGAWRWSQCDIAASESSLLCIFHANNWGVRAPRRCSAAAAGMTAQLSPVSTQIGALSKNTTWIPADRLLLLGLYANIDDGNL